MEQKFIVDHANRLSHLPRYAEMKISALGRSPGWMHLLLLAQILAGCNTTKRTVNFDEVRGGQHLDKAVTIGGMNSSRFG